MRLISIVEYGRLSRADLGPRSVSTLQRFDELHAGRFGQTVFDWSHLRDIRAKSFVGVLQVPGLVVEILPKIDTPLENAGVPSSNDENQKIQVRDNLMFMLSMGGSFPICERDVASQSVKKLPVMEALIWSFVRRLLVELRRGQQHHYIRREENLTCIKGKVLLQRQFVVNATLNHRAYVQYDEFNNNTWLNRIFKASCVRLLSLTRLNRTQQYLREVLLELAEVQELAVEIHHFDLVQLERNSERFRELFRFCRLLYEDSTPAGHFGNTPSFSLLFPMHTVFEEFVGAVLKRHATEFGLARADIHIQSSNHSAWLLRQESGAGHFRLRPDVLVLGPDKKPTIIIDTKWKRLVSDSEDPRNGVSQADIYQLYSYAHRFACQKNLLLFPQVYGATSRIYKFDGDNSGKRLKVAYIDLNYDLRADRERLFCNLRDAMVFS